MKNKPYKELTPEQHALKLKKIRMKYEEAKNRYEDAKANYESWQETLFLFESYENAKRLLKAIHEANSGQLKEYDLD